MINQEQTTINPENAATSKENTSTPNHAGDTAQIFTNTGIFSQQPYGMNETEPKPIDYPSHPELVKKLDAAEKLAEDNWNKFLRSQADAENMRKRLEKDIDSARKYAIEKLALEILPIADNLERFLENKIATPDTALNNAFTGVELTLKILREALQKFNIKEIFPLGEPFNPELHTAMTVREEPSTKANIVLQVMQKGYMLRDRLLRPALVVVSK
jgi:molecular chaperone GrpE